MSNDSEYWDAVADADRALQIFGAMVAAEAGDAELARELGTCATDLDDLVNSGSSTGLPLAEVINIADRRAQRRD